MPRERVSQPLLDGSCDDPDGIAGIPRHRVIIVSKAGNFYRNWKRFLLGTELPRTLPNISTIRSRRNVVESNRRRGSYGDKLS